MTNFAQPQRVRPAALRPGDTVGIIAPAGVIEPDGLEAGCAWLMRKGFQPFYLPSILDRDLYFAGSAGRRLDEFHEMFSRPEVKAIICARGGYGSNYLLADLDLKLVRANPKIFCGCSDVTTLLTYLCDRAGMVTFHGPMLNVDVRPDGVDEESWSAALTSGEAYRRKFSSDEVQRWSRAVGKACSTEAVCRFCARLSEPRMRSTLAARFCFSRIWQSRHIASIAC